MLHQYGIEFLKIAAAHALAVASPGPDFAIVLRQSLAYGRRPAIWTSIGIGSGISIHIAYSLLGIGFLLMHSPIAFTVLKFAGAAYLVWIGIHALRSKPRSESQWKYGREPLAPAPSRGKAWTVGFLTNALNPKATLFFLALFPVVVSPQTPMIVRAAYGVWLVLATMAWFCLVSIVFTHESVRTHFLRHGHWIDRSLGVVFLAFAASLLFATV